MKKETILKLEQIADDLNSMQEYAERAVIKWLELDDNDKGEHEVNRILTKNYPLSGCFNETVASMKDWTNAIQAEIETKLKQ